jgi:hypothetical protein
MKRRLVLVSIAIVALLGSAVAVQAASSAPSGLYKGKTAKGKTRVSLRITKAKRLVHFRFRRIALKCSDDDTLRIPYKDKLDSGPKRLKVYDNGTFAFRVSYDNGGNWTVHGRIRGKRATGRLRLKVRFNTDSRTDPHGKVVCDSGKRKFSARRR